jgi:DNA-binding LytR/AlgR family response regulator
MMHDNEHGNTPSSADADGPGAQPLQRPPGISEGPENSRTANASDMHVATASTSLRLVVPTADGAIYLPCEGIVRLQADGSYTHIHTDNGVRLMTCKGIGLLHRQLPMEWFHRCHSAHVINLRKVHKLLRTGGCRVQMLTGDMVEVSRRKWRELQDVMNSLRA